MLRGQILLTITSLLSLCPVTRAENKVSARVFEYQDKVQDFKIELLTAENTLKNSELELEQIKNDCEHTKQLHAKGYEYLNAIDACKNAVLALETRNAQIRNTVESSARNRDIWTLRLAAEEGAEIKLAELGKKYVQKWTDALKLIAAQITHATNRHRQSLKYYDWALRNRRKGLMTELDFRKAEIAESIAKNEVETLHLREEQFKSALKETETTVARMGAGPPLP